MILALQRQLQLQNHEHISLAWMRYQGTSSTLSRDRPRLTYLARPLVVTAVQSP